jgi:hypothetical protein
LAVLRFAGFFAAFFFVAFFFAGIVEKGSE